MCASQVTHTSTEICNWSTDPSMRNILTVEVRTDTSCTDELLGSSSGDFTIWSSTFWSSLCISKMAQQAICVRFNGRLLPTLSGYPGLTQMHCRNNTMLWWGSQQLSPWKVVASDEVWTCNPPIGGWHTSWCRYRASPGILLFRGLETRGKREVGFPFIIIEPFHVFLLKKK